MSITLFLIFLVFLSIDILIEGGILMLVGKILKINIGYKNSLKMVITFSLSITLLSALFEFIFKLLHLRESADFAGMTAMILLIITMPFILRYYAKSSWKLGLIIFFIYVFLSAFIIPLATFPIREFVISPYVETGDGMSPTLEKNDYFLAKKWDRKFLRGDIVIFENPKKNDQDIVGRIIGLPHEKIEIKEGGIFINKKILEEQYQKERTEGNFSLDLGDREYFILGDNRKNNLDSRSFGIVKEGLIKGKVMYSVHMGKFNLYE